MVEAPPPRPLTEENGLEIHSTQPDNGDNDDDDG